jgi:hypothetical protein
LLPLPLWEQGPPPPHPAGGRRESREIMAALGFLSP